MSLAPMLAEYQGFGVVEPIMSLGPDTLAITWFVLLGVLLVGYAVLDGFDLGVGTMHSLVPRTDDERRITMNSIGPLWDGNEVWLITFGGALFAAFPEAYASVFSGFYSAFYLLLFALILRAVSMEFRGKMHTHAWKRFWDGAFTLGSTLATLLFGISVGNAMIGLPLDERGDIHAGLLDLLRPYPIVVGLLAVAMFAMHGSIYLHLKTEGDLQRRLVPWMWRTYFIFLAMFIAATVYTLTAVPHAQDNLRAYPVLWLVPALNVLAIANIPRAIHKDKAGYAFFSSCCAIAAFIFLFMVALAPNLVTASNDPARSLTLFNASSSTRTLAIMLIVAIIGMPCVLAYSAVIYWTFRGKVRLDEHSY